MWIKASRQRLQVPHLRYDQNPEDRRLNDPLDALGAAFNLKWEGADPEMLSPEIRAIYDRDMASLKHGEQFMAASIETIAGNFDSATIADVRKTLKAAEAEGLSRDETVMWRGNELVISFGWYLVEFVEGELAKRNTGGL